MLVGTDVADEAQAQAFHKLGEKECPKQFRFGFVYHVFWQRLVAVVDTTLVWLQSFSLGATELAG